MELWHQRWFNNQIGFHRLVANDLLIKHWPSLKCQPGANVLVPLCGKTLDMHWLNEQGHKITMAVVRRLETVVTDLRQMG